MPMSTKKRADLKAIGQRIGELRGSERQDDLAPFLGISQGQLSRIERGIQAPTIEVVLRLAERFKTSTEWILRGKKP